MTKSKMRIYKGRGYSDHEVYLYMTVDMEDVAKLHIKTAHEEISLPADDVLEAIKPIFENEDVARQILDSLDDILIGKISDQCEECTVFLEKIEND